MMMNRRPTTLKHTVQYSLVLKMPFDIHYCVIHTASCPSGTPVQYQNTVIYCKVNVECRKKSLEQSSDQRQTRVTFLSYGAQRRMVLSTSEVLPRWTSRFLRNDCTHIQNRTASRPIKEHYAKTPMSHCAQADTWQTARNNLTNKLPAKNFKAAGNLSHKSD